jgi:hypothetical protein
LALCSALCGFTIMLALVTAALQSRNRERGIALDALKQECDMLEAVNGDRCERILVRDWSPLPNAPSPPLEAHGVPRPRAGSLSLAALSEQRGVK